MSHLDWLPMTEAAPHRLALVLCPGFSNLALPLVSEPLFIANWLAGRPLFTWRSFSVDGLAVTTSAGAALAVDAPLGPEDVAETVLVLASFDTHRAAADARLRAWLRRMARTGAILGGIETGSEVLAAAGLLDGRRVAVHWYNVEGFRERFPQTLAEPRRMVIDGRFASSAGATATIDLMLELIRLHAGQATSEEVARHLLVSPGKLGPAEPPSPARIADPLVGRALALIAERLSEPRDIAALTRDLGVSSRQLQRRFAASLGKSIGAVWRERQFARAHQLVQQTELALTEIAIAVGFGSLEAFSRAYRRRFGTPPSRDRAQSTGTSVFGPPDVRGMDE
ncbi:MAG: GlxA family transcriptional regulator [Pararhodobacter sp.]|nr:GlxA family transcriptional regulator [Pararhodobacter sp.]